MNYTSIEQSKKLLELGLSPESADCMWEQHNSETSYITVKPHTTLGRSIGAHTIPCWSVGALLEVMPKEISIPDEDEDFPPRVCYPFLEACTWSEDYLWYGGLVDDAKCHKPMFKSNDILEIVYSTVVWLLENNYIKHQ